jgi:hypothetical protein
MFLNLVNDEKYWGRICCYLTKKNEGWWIEGRIHKPQNAFWPLHVYFPMFSMNSTNIKKK